MPRHDLPPRGWICRDRCFDVRACSLVMGIVNVTPDSFSDGGRYLEPQAATDHARRLFDEGADLVDLGAESTRPGSDPVPPAEQLRRLMPVVQALMPRGACLSIDTSSAEVANTCLAAGAQIVNDVTALGDPAMAGVVARHQAGLVLMHMRGTPSTMQHDPHYEDVAIEVRDWLAARLEVATRAGIPAERLALDPGIGFGKTVRHNLELLARSDELADLGRPLLIGVSRKRFIGQLTDTRVDDRLEGSLAAAAVAVFMGAHIVRVHDVASTKRALRIATALRNNRRERAHLLDL